MTKLLSVAVVLAITTTSLASPIRGFAPRDVNRDGKPDVILWRARNDQRMSIEVMLNDGKGRLQAPVASGAAPIGSAAVGDVDGDGNGDVVVLASSGKSAVLRGQRGGTFAAPIAFDESADATPLLADFDRDGRDDLLVIEPSTMHLRHSNGDGTFGASVAIPFSGTVVAVADVNGDRAPDLVTWAFQTTLVTLNDGHGRFEKQVAMNEDYVIFAAAADFNRDGKADLLLLGFNGAEVRLGNGDGTFAASILTTLRPAPAVEPENHASRVIAADFDGDGRMDFAVHGDVFLGNGDGTFRSRVALKAIDTPQPAGADLDGDGSAELSFIAGDSVDVAKIPRQSAKPAAHSIALEIDKTEAQYGQPVTLAARVGSMPLAGVVRFAANGRPLALIQPDANGEAKLTAGLPRGSLAIVATYTGDPQSADAEAVKNLVVAKAALELHLRALRNPIVYPQKAQVYAQIRGTSAQYQPTGTIVLREGDAVLGSIPANGKFIDVALPPGAHTIAASYPGDDNFEPASASLAITVAQPLLPK